MTHNSRTKAHPSLLTFIARLTAYRPGHSLLRFVMRLLFHNRALLVGLLSKAYIDALSGATARSGLAALPAITIVVLLALEGLAELGLEFAQFVVDGSLGSSGATGESPALTSALPPTFA